LAFACRALYPSEMEPVTLSDNCTESSLAILFHGVLTDCARRHGGYLRGLHSRISFVATDAGETITLCFADGRCHIEGDLQQPDLILQADSDLLPRLETLPIVFGVPVLASPAGVSLLLTLLQRPVWLRDLSGTLRHPLRALRAMVDIGLLVRLLAGGVT
jgi:hypothetical protein